MDFTKIRNYLFLGALFIVTILFLSLLKVFAYPIFWAAIIAAISYPFYKRLKKTIKNTTLSVSLVLVIITIIVIIPLSILGTLLVKESINLYETFNNNRENVSLTLRGIFDGIIQNPYIAKLQIDEAFLTNKISEYSGTALAYIFNFLKDVTQISFEFLLMFIIMLYTLFFFIRDGELLLKKLMYICPLGDKYEVMLYERFTSTVRATLKGTVIIGVIQGTIGGILFAIAGIPGVLIWSVIMTLLSVIPGVGSSIIWAPAGIIMLLTGQIWQGVLILVAGTLLISTIDNLLRPRLVGKDIQMHELLIFFSTLGGIAVFGISGFIIGPIIASLFVSFWQIYEHYYRTELSNNKRGL